MNKIVKKILKGIGVVLLLLVLVGGYFYYRFTSETNKMTPVETGQINKNAFAIKDDFVNMYLLRDSIGYIAIDAGKDIANVKKGLEKLNIKPEEVIAVFLTHSDPDHVAGVSLFPNAKLYMARNEMKMLNGEKQKMPMVNNSISRKDINLLDDKQVLTIGSHKINCILTEGHTSGSMCYQINEKYLFTGDILSLHNGKLGHSVKFFDLDHDMTTKSITQITNIAGVEYILTSHWGISTDYKNAVKDWKE